jgi:hypothetical protein
VRLCPDKLGPNRELAKEPQSGATPAGLSIDGNLNLGVPVHVAATSRAITASRRLNVLDAQVTAYDMPKLISGCIDP